MITPSTVTMGLKNHKTSFAGEQNPYILQDLKLKSQKISPRFLMIEGNTFTDMNFETFRSGTRLGYGNQFRYDFYSWQKKYHTSK